MYQIKILNGSKWEIVKDNQGLNYVFKDMETVNLFIKHNLTRFPFSSIKVISI